MQNFEEIKSIWSDIAPGRDFTRQTLDDRKRDQLARLKQQYLWSAIGLSGFTLFVVWFAFLSGRNFIYNLSYIALLLLAACSFLMVLINLQNVLLTAKIDDTLVPREYLYRWLVFYKKRFRFFAFYGPILFLVVCFSFALYVPEILGYYPNAYYKVGFTAFIILLFIGYRSLGRKTIAKEKMALNELNTTIRALGEE